jgi:CPA1 family monovalent cation:H+ antiporter
MTLLEIAAVFLTILALLGWGNAMTLRLPPSVATLSAGLLAAAILFVAQTSIGPFWGFNLVRTHVAKLDFTGAVLNYMLAFLLFAGGLQADLGEFRKRQLPILSLATFGVLISTGLVGGGLWLAARALGIALPLSWALVFGALISPTDPVAVIGQVKSGGLSTRLGAILQGEALFNDGVGVVAFTAAVAFATSGALPDPLHTAGAIVLEAGGGLVIGWVCGRLVVRALAPVDDYVVALTASLPWPSASMRWPWRSSSPGRSRPRRPAWPWVAMAPSRPRANRAVATSTASGTRSTRS